MANYIGEELEWLENRLLEIKEDVDSNPYSEISDRIVSLMGAHGPSEKVVASAEAQKTALRAALKEYVVLLEMVDKLREKEEQKQIEARGNVEVSPRVKALLNKN